MKGPCAKNVCCRARRSSVHNPPPFPHPTPSSYSEKHPPQAIFTANCVRSWLVSKRTATSRATTDHASMHEAMRNEARACPSRARRARRKAEEPKVMAQAEIRPMARWVGNSDALCPLLGEGSCIGRRLATPSGSCSSPETRRPSPTSRRRCRRGRAPLRAGAPSGESHPPEAHDSPTVFIHTSAMITAMVCYTGWDSGETCRPRILFAGIHKSINSKTEPHISRYDAS